MLKQWCTAAKFLSNLGAPRRPNHAYHTRTCSSRSRKLGRVSDFGCISVRETPTRYDGCCNPQLLDIPDTNRSIFLSINTPNIMTTPPDDTNRATNPTRVSDVFPHIHGNPGSMPLSLDPFTVTTQAGISTFVLLKCRRPRVDMAQVFSHSSHPKLGSLRRLHPSRTCV